MILASADLSQYTRVTGDRQTDNLKPELCSTIAACNVRLKFIKNLMRKISNSSGRLKKRFKALCGQWLGLPTMMQASREQLFASCGGWSETMKGDRRTPYRAQTGAAAHHRILQLPCDVAAHHILCSCQPLTRPPDHLAPIHAFVVDLPINCIAHKNDDNCNAVCKQIRALWSHERQGDCSACVTFTERT